MKDTIHSMLPFPQNSLLLAPMVGITNRAFRTLLDELGSPDYAFTEMASAEAYISNAPFETDYTDPRPNPKLTSVQFYARSAKNLAEACIRLKDRPEEVLPAGVDINFGCAAPHIRKSGGGSAWSSDPTKAADLVAAARASWQGILSAKVRMGPDEDYPRLLAFCQALADQGLDFLSLHPRTDGQKFRRSPRHDYTLRLAQDISCPLVANGDIVDAGQLDMLMGTGTEKTDSDNPKAWAVMIGREAVRKPWIFAQLRSRPLAGLTAPGTIKDIDRMEIGLRFLKLVELYLPEAWQLESSRRFFSYYCEQFTFAHHIKYKIMNSPSLEQMGTTLARYFDQVPGDRIIKPKNIQRRVH
ncbi:MAG: tRNA-dihydrouridine synthase family protein [Spirochaetia bacterium]|jgi:tRNA-dihydrouridine synthase|nr:tRNA-dihydrouridine synthase family protein [Spirochaetia bacterium]